MPSALITATSLSMAGLIGAFVSGVMVDGGSALRQHATFAVFATLLLLLCHSLTMFYLIGKGKAIREAAADGGLSPDFGVQVSQVRRPVFSQASAAMALTMATAIIGGGVDTGVVPSAIHSILGGLAVVVNLSTLRVEVRALVSSTRIAGEVDRLLAA